MKLSKSFFLLIMIMSLLLCMIFTYSFAQQKERGIHFFNGTMNEAFARAKKEKKDVFFDAYASWCGPCKNMDSLVYTRAEVGNFFNKNFICVRVDMEKGEGPSLAKKFRSINGYPSLLFFTSDGFVIKTLLGSRSANALIKEAKLALVN